jgi:GMP synthase-like glutamine amidotransferase
MTIGLLLCDRVREKYRTEHGEYSEMYHNFLPDFQFIDYQCFEGEIPDDPNSCDAWMATGSLHSVYDDIQWIKELQGFIRKIADSKSKYVGVCFGHQLLGESMGGKVKKADAGWCVGVHTFPILKKATWMQPDSEEYNLLMMCQDQVVKLPENSIVYAGTDYCPVGMFTVGSNMLGIQGHPEFSKSYDKALMIDRRDRIGDEKVDRALLSLTSNVNTDLLRSWVYAFIKST